MPWKLSKKRHRRIVRYRSKWIVELARERRAERRARRRQRLAYLAQKPVPMEPSFRESPGQRHDRWFHRDNTCWCSTETVRANRGVCGALVLRDGRRQCTNLPF